MVVDYVSDVEGLAYEEATDALLLACKEPKGKKKKARVRIHRWSLKERAAHPASPLEIPLASLDAGKKSESFHPSGIEVHPESGHYFLVSAQAIAIAEVTPEGEVVAVARIALAAIMAHNLGREIQMEAYERAREVGQRGT